MFHIVLYQPVIPQNTGSIARLCACTGAELHLIKPLGFDVDEASVRRAGLDYWPHVKVTTYENWNDFVKIQSPEHLFFYSKFSTVPYTKAEYPLQSYLVFGSETKGLPDDLREDYPKSFFKIPMRTNIVRSLNLSQSAAIVVYEALRQNEYPEI